jgi:exodeoxyribonuclease V alpha subunit
MKESQSGQELQGTVERILYRNEENGYAVAKIKPNKSSNLVTITGILAGVNIGEYLQMQGQWVLHPEYGQQFQLASYQVNQPATEEGIIKYLSSTLIKGIGPKMAERIVTAFGAQTLEIIEESPERLVEVPGIGKERMLTISQGWSEQKTVKSIMLFLHSNNVSTNLAVKIYKKYGDKSIQALRSNPYCLVEDIYGIGFKTADLIARNLGLETSSPNRLQAGLKHILITFAEEGNCYALKEDLVVRCQQLLEVPLGAVEIRLAAMIEAKTLVREGPNIYIPGLYNAEKKSAEKLKALIIYHQRALQSLTEIDWDKAFSWLSSKLKITYAEKQRQAIKGAITGKVTIITGGAGTGKSTVIDSIVKLVTIKNKKVLLAAPTGRAAKRMTELTGFPAQTIHRLLEFSYTGSLSFRRNEENPLDADIIVVDETSMIDVLLFRHLMKAVRFDTHLVLIGDVNQLPSVGPGNVLKDLISSERIPVTYLDVCFRQSEHSFIVSNAHRILEGKMPFFTQRQGDFFLFNAAEPAKAVELITEIVAEKIPKVFGFDPYKDIQVLAPMYKGEIGINELNSKLQELLNPSTSPDKELILSTRTYRVNDKIIQLKNDYEKEVFNGDMGIISRIDRELHSLTILFDGRAVEYEPNELDQISHSYAISIHKSQGSEFPVVVIPLLTQHYIMLQRNLLYTAVSRAKKMVVLVGNSKAIGIALKNNRTIDRNTSLKSFICASSQPAV